MRRAIGWLLAISLWLWCFVPTANAWADDPDCNDRTDECEIVIVDPGHPSDPDPGDPQASQFLLGLFSRCICSHCGRFSVRLSSAMSGDAVPTAAGVFLRRKEADLACAIHGTVACIPSGVSVCVCSRLAFGLVFALQIADPVRSNRIFFLFKI